MDPKPPQERRGSTGGIICTSYSALGIDWTRTVEDTPLERTFHYVEPASGTKYTKFAPVQDLLT